MRTILPRCVNMNARRDYHSILPLCLGFAGQLTVNRMQTYRAHPLLRSGHLQTLMVGLSSGWRPPHRAWPIEIDLPDGERLLAHEELPQATASAALADDAPLVILLHGLGGDHRSPYLQRLAYHLRQAGQRVWRIDLRGSGHGLKLAWRPAHAGSSGDLAAVIQHATRLYPHASLRIVGFSLSGNILLKMLGEAARHCLQPAIPLEAIAHAYAIAPPVDLHACADNMDRWSRRLYSHYYLKMLDQQVHLRRSQWPQWHAIPASPSVRTIRQFDARYTAPLSGFRDTDHYYTESSALDWLPHITTRTTILADQHDPIVSNACFARAQLNQQSTNLVTTSYGGHMGYFGIDARGRTVRWLERFMLEQLCAGVASADQRSAG